MKRLYAPWRTNYVQKVHKGDNDSAVKDDCVFCQKFAEWNDDKHFILRRFRYHAVLLNLFPYNAGHLLLVSLEHKDCLNELSKEARSELIELTNQSILVLQKALQPAGFNVGLNLGKAGGAGIPHHIHQHVLPRWTGDTNFLPLLAQTKQISVDLEKLFEQLKPLFTAIDSTK